MRRFSRLLCRAPGRPGTAVREYTHLIAVGLIDVKATPVVERETPVTTVVDARNGFGPPAARFAMTCCVEKARTTGLAMVTVRNSNHFGIAGYYALMAAREGLVGMAATNAGPQVVPLHGREPMLGPELSEKTLGIVGLGRVGKSVALLGRADYVPLGKLLRAADFVSLHGLRELPNVILTPHMGGSATEALARMMELALLNVTQVLDGAEPMGRMN